MQSNKCQVKKGIMNSLDLLTTFVLKGPRKLLSVIAARAGKVLIIRAVMQPVRPLLLHGVSPPQVQNFAFAFFSFNDVPINPFL